MPTLTGHGDLRSFYSLLACFPSVFVSSIMLVCYGCLSVGLVSLLCCCSLIYNEQELLAFKCMRRFSCRWLLSVLLRHGDKYILSSGLSVHLHGVIKNRIISQCLPCCCYPVIIGVYSINWWN